MELNFQSVLSPAGLVGHSAYLLLVFSMVMRNMVWLRILVIASALVSIAYGLFILTDPVSVFWEAMLIGVNIIQLSITAWQNCRARFSPVEADFIARHFATLAPAQIRRLLDLGCWQELPAGTVLCAEGQQVDKLHYLHEGSASFSVNDRTIGQCESGAFVGELTVATDEPANGTVILEAPGYVWSVEADRLRRAMERQPELARALEASFFAEVRDKLLRRDLTSAMTVSRRFVRRPKPARDEPL